MMPKPQVCSEDPESLILIQCRLVYFNLWRRNGFLYIRKPIADKGSSEEECSNQTRPSESEAPRPTSNMESFTVIDPDFPRPDIQPYSCIVPDCYLHQTRSNYGTSKTKLELLEHLENYHTCREDSRWFNQCHCAPGAHCATRTIHRDPIAEKSEYWASKSGLLDHISEEMYSFSLQSLP